MYLRNRLFVHARACVRRLHHKRTTDQTGIQNQRREERKRENKMRCDRQRRWKKVGRRGSRHEPNRNQHPTRLDQHLDAFYLSLSLFSPFALSLILFFYSLTIYLLFHSLNLLLLYKNSVCVYVILMCSIFNVINTNNTISPLLRINRINFMCL